MSEDKKLEIRWMIYKEDSDGCFIKTQDGSVILEFTQDYI